MITRDVYISIYDGRKLIHKLGKRTIQALPLIFMISSLNPRVIREEKLKQKDSRDILHFPKVL